VWFVLFMLLLAAILGTAALIATGWSLWRSVKRLGRAAQALADRASTAANHLSTLRTIPADPATGNPDRSVGRTMDVTARPGR
jgi:hypothetical protein